MKHKKAFAAAAAVLLLTAGGGYFAMQNAQAAEKDALPVNERQYPVTRGTITVGIDGVGKVEVENKVYSLPKDIAVSEIFVKEGDWVKEGQALFGLSEQEAQKHRDALEKQRETLEDKLEDLEDDRTDYLDSMTWKLENDRERSSNRYYNALWEINNRIENLEYELSDAEWKRDYVTDDALSRATVEKLQKELTEKQAEKEALNRNRTAEEEQEDDPAYQKKKQDEAVAAFDAKIDGCRQELKSLKRQEKKAESPKILAEKEGVVLKVNAKAGEPFSLEIGEKDSMLLRLTIEPEDIVDVQEGQAASFSLDSYPDALLSGTVKKRILAPDSNGKFAVLVAVDPESREQTELLPGLTASGVLIVKQKADVLTLPNKAIILRDGRQYIQVRNAEGLLEEREVETGFSDGRLTEILSGAEEGDIAVTQVTV